MLAYLIAQLATMITNVARLVTRGSRPAPRKTHELIRLLSRYIAGCIARVGGYVVPRGGRSYWF